MNDTIYRQVAIDAALSFMVEYCGAAFDEDMQTKMKQRLEDLPSAQSKDNDYSYMGDPWEYFANTKDGDLSETEKQIKFIMWFGYAKGKKAMREAQLGADALINAIRQKWNDEHPVYEDTSGSMTYSEIIDFIKAFAKNDSNLK